MDNIHKKVVRIISQNIELDLLEPYKNKNTSSYIGSGFFIDLDGTLLTCSHLVINSKKIFVEIPSEGKKKYEAKIILTCPDYDIAVLKILDYKNEHYLELLHEDFFENIEAGMETMAIGFPLGQDNLKITQGIISGRDEGLIQTSAALNSGNSGGPMLYNDYVIGINVSKISHANNIGYASPIIYYYNIEYSNLNKTKLIKTPILGIHYTNLDDAYIELNNLKCKSGTLIKFVHKNSPLWNCGVRKGHILCKINNHNVDNYGLTDKYWFNEKMSINDLKKTFKLDQKIPISYFNKKKIVNTHFKFTFFDLKIRKMYPLFDYNNNIFEVFGGIIASNLNINLLNLLINDNFKLNYKMARLANLYTDRSIDRVIITNIFPNTKIDNQDILRVGDIITKVNNIDVENVVDYKKALTQPIKKNNKYFIKFETADHKQAVLYLSEILKEELLNTELYKYNFSTSYKILKKNKMIKTKKNKKSIKKKTKHKLKDKKK